MEWQSFSNAVRRCVPASNPPSIWPCPLHFVVDLWTECTSVSPFSFTSCCCWSTSPWGHQRVWSYSERCSSILSPSPPVQLTTSSAWNNLYLTNIRRTESSVPRKFHFQLNKETSYWRHRTCGNRWTPKTTGQAQEVVNQIQMPVDYKQIECLIRMQKGVQTTIAHYGSVSFPLVWQNIKQQNSPDSLPIVLLQPCLLPCR